MQHNIAVKFSLVNKFAYNILVGMYMNYTEFRNEYK